MRGPTVGDRLIEIEHLTKRFGDKTAVDDVTFSVQSGIVTGFLGPNGAGKSTTMRVLLGLDAPTSGSARIDGKAYRDLPAPLTEIGAMLEARAIHTGRSAYHHLMAMAQTHGIGRSRVEEVVELVGLSDVARQRVGTFSLGMGQRLGIAAALLGDPSTVILDEPANGLDPEGILWIRNLLRGMAAQGKTVFLSSHLLAEIAQTADHLVVIGRGRLIADTSVADVLSKASADAAVRVRSPNAAELREMLRGQGATVTAHGDDVLEVSGHTAEEIGTAAASRGLVLHELTPGQASLEEAFLRMTGGAVEYHAQPLPDTESAS